MANICRLPQDSKNTVINANIGGTTDTHYQVPFHHIQQKCLLELSAPGWKEWAFTDGSCLQQQERKLISVYWSWIVPPSIQQNHHSKSWADKHQHNHKQSRSSRNRCCSNMWTHQNCDRQCWCQTPRNHHTPHPAMWTHQNCDRQCWCQTPRNHHTPHPAIDRHHPFLPG